MRGHCGYGTERVGYGLYRRRVQPAAQPEATNELVSA
jgi:hypothetical protein